MSEFTQFLPVVFFSAMAFWKTNPVLFMLAGGTAVFNGFYWYDQYTTFLGLAIGLCLIAYALLCFGYAFRYIFWRESSE